MGLSEGELEKSLMIGSVMADFASIQKKIISFRNERDWAQFHGFFSDVHVTHDPSSAARCIVF
jgi:hypothetical protein